MVCLSIKDKFIEYKSKNKLCKAEDCLHPARTRNLCPMHYQRLRRHGSIDVTKKPRVSSYREVPVPFRCTADGCDRAATVHSYCSKHYQRWRKHGSTNITQSPGRPRSLDGRTLDLCAARGCPNVAVIQGLCRGHNAAQRYCQADGCDRPHLKSQAYCAIHYTPEICLEPYCEYEQYTGGRCIKHYRQSIRNLSTYNRTVLE